MLKNLMLWSALWSVASGIAVPACAADVAGTTGEMTLHMRSRAESPKGSGQFDAVYKTAHWDPQKTAIIICDMWDRHWCKSATDRVAEMAPRINDFVTEARKRGALIVHAPSDCMKAYADHPARKRAQAAPAVRLPDCLKNWQGGPLPAEKGAKWPIDDSDGGCDCAPQCAQGMPYRRQIATLKIADEDAISDSGIEIGNLFVQRGIENVIFTGVHANMCVVGRPFGLRNLVRFGKNVVLVRDLTDAMYNSRKAPHVSHIRGTELVVEHIEKYICPTIASSDLLGGPAFRFRQDKRPHVVLVSYEDEYHAAETLPRFAQELCDRYGCYCSFLPGEKKTGILGLEELATADVLVLYVRRHALPKEQMGMIRRYLDAGKPLVALRTACHAFDIKAKAPEGMEVWPTFDHDVLGGNYHGHRGAGSRTEIVAADNAAGHPILAGLQLSHWSSPALLYNVSPIDHNATVLLTGRCQDGVEPIAWTHTYRDGRVFYTSLGHVDDFRTPQFRRLLANAIYWAMDKRVGQTSALQLTLPPVCHAVVGVPMSIYFDNIVLTEKPEQYRFKVEGNLGTTEARRWTITPGASDVGDHALSVSAGDAQGNVIAGAKSILHVAPADAGAGRSIRLLLVGDSLTHQTIYPNEIARLLSQPGNPAWTMLGTHRPPEAAKGVMHEGYGGWTWERFESHYVAPKPGLTYKERGSPFVFAAADGKPALDLPRYFDSSCGGQRPDVVTFLLGCNDCFHLNPEDPVAMDAQIGAVFGHADKLIAAFRQAAPKAELGICLMPPPNSRESGFQASYHGAFHRWGWKRIQHRLVQREIEHFGGSQGERIFIVPTELNLDPTAGYPVDNGVHPNVTGYQQVGDSIFAWLKSRLEAW